MATLEDHPLAAIFPLMGDADLTALADDIEANGLRDAVWLYEGKILDGRNRYRACMSRDIDHRVERYTGKDPLGFVISKNLHRRHLTESQRAMVAANIAKWKVGDNQHTAKEGSGIPLPSQATAAGMLGVSVDSVKAATRVKADGVPELVEAVEKGDVSVSAAAEVAKLPKAKQKAAVAAGPKKVKEVAAGERAKRKPAAEGPAPCKSQRPASDPFADAGRESTADDPAPDLRFMPHATEAADIAAKFRNWKQRLESLRGELRKTFPDRHHVVAGRIDARGQFEASLSELIDTLDRNVPEHVCPACCGTGGDAGACKFCDAYGIIDHAHHAGLVPRWKKTAGRLAALVAAAEGGAA